MASKHFKVNRALVKGIISSSPYTKQRLGRRIAENLGFEPGNMGPDGGIDGSIYYEGEYYHFQSKLKNKKLGPDTAGKQFSDIDYYDFDVSIILSGTGFTKKFVDRIRTHESKHSFEVRMLKLMDVFAETDKFKEVSRDFPPIRKLQDVDWEDFNGA